MLRWKLDAFGPFERAEWDFLNVPSAVKSNREEGLVPNVFFIVHQLGLNVYALYAVVEPHSRCESAVAKRMRNTEFGQYRSAVECPICSRLCIAEERLILLWNRLPVSHRNVATAVQSTIKLPQIAFVLLARDHVRAASQRFPFKVLVQETGHLTCPSIERDPIEFVFDGIIPHVGCRFCRG